MPDRIEKRPLPEVEIIDMRQEFQETGHEQVISRKLARRNQRSARAQRAGHGPAEPPRIFAVSPYAAPAAKRSSAKTAPSRMTHHKRGQRMECHYCGYTAPVPKVCVHCGSEYVYFIGTGSEKLEELLHGMFPQARIGRLDRDTVRGREDFERALNALERRRTRHAGWHADDRQRPRHPRRDAGRSSWCRRRARLPRFPRSRAYVPTCSPRLPDVPDAGNSPGKVVLQTYFPDHYAVQYAAQHDFAGFYDKELRFRSWMHYPPYSALANVLIRSNKLDEALQWSGTLGKWFEKTRHEGVRVLGPAAAPITRLEAGLPLSLRAEVSEPRKTKRDLARDAGVCRIAKNPTYPGNRGCGRSLADVRSGCQTRVQHLSAVRCRCNPFFAEIPAPHPSRPAFAIHGVIESAHVVVGDLACEVTQHGPPSE